MTVIRQAFAALRVALSSLGSRLWSSLNTVLGTAVVVMVMVAILSIGAGYREAMDLSQVDDGVMILRGGAQSEMESTLTGEEAALILSRRAAALGDGASPGAVAELYAVTSLTDAQGEAINVALRGVGPDSAALRSSYRLIEGRPFVAGRRELVVGRRAQAHFGGLDLGGTVRIAGADWTVVGTFETGGSITESEMWADLGMAQAALKRRDTVQVVQSRLAPGETASDVANALNSDGRLNLRVVDLRDYYGGQADSMQRFVTVLGMVIVSLMSLGAIFAALNTGYSHVRARAKELATLSVLGWTNGSLSLAIALEAVLLNLSGALIGAVASYLLFDGRMISTLFHAKDFTQVVFTFAVTPSVFLQAMLLALVIGLLASIGPALQMRRLPVSRLLLQRG